MTQVDYVQLMVEYSCSEISRVLPAAYWGGTCCQQQRQSDHIWRDPLTQWHTHAHTHWRLNTACILHKTRRVPKLEYMNSQESNTSHFFHIIACACVCVCVHKHIYMYIYTQSICTHIYIYISQELINSLPSCKVHIHQLKFHQHNDSLGTTNILGGFI